MRIRTALLTLALFLVAPASALADGGSVVGTVYLDDQPGSGLCVDVVDSGENTVASQLTNGGGDYNLYVAQPGTYTVRFGDCGQGYTTTQSAPAQVVSDEITPNVNGYLYSAGRVTGHLEDTLHAVLTGACVTAEDQNGYDIAQTTTDGNGNYALGGLPAGTTRISFAGCSAGNYVREYYDDARTRLSATPVTVQTGDTTSGIDAVLAAAGRIAGHIHNADGEPLANICVWVGVDGYDVGSAITDPAGHYEIAEVAQSGDYEVGASPCYDTGYMPRHKSGVLSAGTGTTTVDLTLPRPGYITGHVTGDDAALGSICVTGKNTVTGEEATGETAPNGYYELNWIAPGTWDLMFADCHATGDWVSAAKPGVLLDDGETLFDVDTLLAHPAPDAGGGPAAGSGGSSTDASGPAAGGSSGGDGGSSTGGSTEDAIGHGAGVNQPAARCTVPKLVGLALAKAKRTLRAAHCRLGKVRGKRATARKKRRTVVAQKTRRGVSRPAGFKVAVTVAK